MRSSDAIISVIVPVLNEEGLIGEFLRRVRSLDERLEIIVVDGGSSDRSVSIAETIADRVITAPRGRASQMNAGAELAGADTLWFLHADLKPAANSIAQITATLGDPQVAGGCFRLHYPRPESIYRVSDSLGNAGVTVFGFALGDHGIFCRRAAFAGVGGYPGVPILEEAELYRRLKRIGRMKQARESIVSDPRTFEKCGRYRTTFIYFLILVLYVVGAPMSWLNRIYCRFHLGRRETPVAATVTTASAPAA